MPGLRSYQIDGAVSELAAEDLPDRNLLNEDLTLDLLNLPKRSDTSDLRSLR
jgi:hypothetical protein